MYSAEEFTPPKPSLSVNSVVTKMIFAPGATAPDHSTSRSDSPSSPETNPGSAPLVMTSRHGDVTQGEFKVYVNGSSPKTLRKSVTSCRLILDCATIAMLTPLPS